MKKIEIRETNTENMDDLISLCIPLEKKEDRLFIEGAGVKKRWISQVMNRYGNFAKLAYSNEKPVGMIQFLPKPEEKLIEITCIFVPEKENLRKGIGKMLLSTLVEEAKEPKPYFDNDSALALIAWAFQVPGIYPQHEFYKKMGFKEASKDEPFSFYYPLKDGYTYTLKSKKYIPQEEDKGKALIFFNPTCPFCMYFSEKIIESLKEVSPDIYIIMINQFEEVEEIKKREKVSFCIVNQKPIESFFSDKENFQREVREALEK
jgi:GNAT superfamily N-acetyltransferase